MRSELKPCPFCGSRNVAQGASGDRISVWCFCGARGPDVAFPEYSIEPAKPIKECYELWNRRTIEAPPPGWPDPLESPQAKAIRNGKMDDTEIRNLFDTMERELRLHRERAGEARPVAVKALEWIAEGDASFAAKSLAGSYVIGKDEKGGKGWQWGFVGDARDWTISEFFDTSDEAKAAAQADYERRILSCLDAPVLATPAQGVTDDARRALKYWIDGTEIVEGCLKKAHNAKPEDAPFGMDRGEAKIWHEAQESAYQHALEMMGVPVASGPMILTAALLPATDTARPLNSGEVEDLIARITPGNFHHFREAGDLIGWCERLREDLSAALSSAPSTPEGWRSKAAGDVLAERKRQVDAEGWTPEHDDKYVDGQLAAAATCYAFTAARSAHHLYNYVWPWSSDWWKPDGKRRNLVKAGALILAEIERLDRLPTPPAGGSSDA